MNLKVVSCADVVMDETVRHVTIEDQTGSLGIRPGHAPLVTALVQGIVTARRPDNSELYVAVDGGVAVVTPTQVRIASRQAASSTNLAELENSVLKQFETNAQKGRDNQVAFEKMKLRFVRSMLKFDQPGDFR